MVVVMVHIQVRFLGWAKVLPMASSKVVLIMLQSCQGGGSSVLKDSDPLAPNVACDDAICGSKNPSRAHLHPSGTPRDSHHEAPIPNGVSSNQDLFGCMGFASKWLALFGVKPKDKSSFPRIQNLSNPVASEFFLSIPDNLIIVFC